MLSKNPKSLLIILVCVVFLFLIVYFPNIVTEKNSAYRQLLEFSSKIQMNEAVYLFNFEMNNKMTGLIVPNIPIFARNNEYGTGFLYDVVSNNPILIYRYGEIKCTSCFETEFKNFQMEFEGKPTLASILCSYEDEREFRTFIRLNQIKLPMYRIPQDAFNWEIEQYGNPYYFVLHPDMKISHIYVPNKDYPELNRQYLEGVKRFLQ